MMSTASKTLGSALMLIATCAAFIGCGGSQPTANKGGRVCPPPAPLPTCTDTTDTIEASALTQDLENHHNQQVRITGTLIQRGADCTRRGCSDANPCCNTCGGLIEFKDALGLELRDLKDPLRFGCQGDECTMCCGIDVSNPTKRVILTGTVQRTSAVAYRIQYKDLCQLP